MDARLKIMLKKKAIKKEIIIYQAKSGAIELRGDFKRDPYHNWASHQADQFRYAAVVEDKMTNEAQDATRAITGKIELDPYPKRVTPDYQVSFSGGTLDEDPYE